MERRLTILVLVVIALLNVCLCEALQWRCYDIHNGCIDCYANVPDTDCGIQRIVCSDGWQYTHIWCSS